MYYPFGSCLVLLFFFSLFYHLPCASSKEGLAWCETIQFQCGNITAGFPFWGGNRPEPCGHAPLELRCNSKNITSLNISNHEYHVYHINHTSSTLRIVRADLLCSFCSATFNSTTFPPEISELSPMYKSLTIFNHCNPRLNYVSSYKCPGKGVLSAYQNPTYQRFCQGSFTVNVPTRFFTEEKELNMTRLESVLRKGFDLKVNTDEIICEECTSSISEHYGRCSQPFRCGDQGSLLYPLFKIFGFLQQFTLFGYSKEQVFAAFTGDKDPSTLWLSVICHLGHAEVYNSCPESINRRNDSAGSSRTQSPYADPAVTEEIAIAVLDMYPTLLSLASAYSRQ